MIWSIPALQDTTIYEKDQYRNAGLDQILELRREGNFTTSSFTESRILMKFDISQLPTILSQNGISINDISASLKLYTAQEYELPATRTIEVKALVNNWKNGSGFHYFPAGIQNSDSTTDGATWITTQGTGSAIWSTGSGIDTNYNKNPGGASWYTSSIVSQSFSYKTQDDVNLDVTQIVKNWVNNVYDNNGVAITLKNSELTGSNIPNTNIQFHSCDTHTVYEPHLYISWTGSLTYSTGSLGAMTFEDDPIVYVRSFNAEFLKDKKNRILIASRPKYPRPAFTQNSTFAGIKALPKNSYYQIKDAHNDQIIIPYSEATKINTNTSGSYFDFYTTMMYPERYYKFEIQANFTDFTDYFSSNEFIFKIVK